MTGPQPLPEWALHMVWSSASSYSFKYSLFSLRSFSSCLCLFNLSSHYFYPSFNNVFIRQFLQRMWPIQLAFLLVIVYRIFLSILILRSTSFATDLLPSLAPYFKTFQVYLVYFLKCSSFSIIQRFACLDVADFLSMHGIYLLQSIIGLINCRTQLSGG